MESSDTRHRKFFFHNWKFDSSKRVRSELSWSTKKKEKREKRKIKKGKGEKEEKRRGKKKRGKKERNVSSRYGSLKLCFFPA